MKPLLVILGLLVAGSSVAEAAYVTTGVYSDFDIFMDNGNTYLTGLPTGFVMGGNCLYNRLELRDTGDRFGSVENARRMMALLLSAKMSGLKVRLGYDDVDGPNCRVAEVWVQW